MNHKNTALHLLLATSLGAILLIVSFLLCTLLQSCTYSITMVHTEGTANDVVDETQSTQADIKPNLTVPLTP
jgi:hypothetical protein